MLPFSTLSRFSFMMRTDRGPRYAIYVVAHRARLRQRLKITAGGCVGSDRTPQLHLGDVRSQAFQKLRKGTNFEWQDRLRILKRQDRSRGRQQLIDGGRLAQFVSARQRGPLRWTW